MYYWTRDGVMERVMYLCDAQETTQHSVPLVKGWLLLEGDVTVETVGWVRRTKAGVEECVPTNDERRAVKGWSRRRARHKLRPGELVLVKSGFTQRLKGSGKVVITFLLPDSVEGQHALVRKDYRMGLAVVAPSSAEELLQKLFPLLDARSGVTERAAGDAYEAVAALVAPPPAPSLLMPAEPLTMVRTVREVCRLETFERESHRRIKLKPMARLLRLTPKKVETIFREHVLTRPCFFVPFMRHAASMYYYFARKHQALLDHKRLDINVSYLAMQVWYDSREQFSKQFRRLHGITAETFLNADISFFPVELDSH
jgi:AraC-like DNA-binding protein